jgi:hypothetical protein
LNKCVQKLKRINNAQSLKFHKVLEKVHRVQKLLLDTIYLIYVPMPEDIKSSRDYRQMLPIEDQSELDGGFSENILFAAQAIAAGFRVRGIERHSDMLREPARQLCASFSAVLHVFRRRSLENPNPPYLPELIPVMRDFDWTWTRFEQKICFCYFSLIGGGDRSSNSTAANGTGPSSYDLANDELFAILMSETIMRALDYGFFSGEDVQNCEPYLIFAIPRLALVNGLVTLNGYSNYIVGENTRFEWFGPKRNELLKIRDALAELTPQQVSELERMIVYSQKPPPQSDNSGNKYDDFDLSDTPELKCDLLSQVDVVECCDGRDEGLKQLFCDIAQVCDRLQTGPKAREFAKLMRRVFKMHQDDSVDEAALNKGTTTKRLTHRSSRFESARFAAWRSNDPFPRNNEFEHASDRPRPLAVNTLSLRPSFEIEQV